MTDTATGPVPARTETGAPLIEMTSVGKFYGAIRALEGINLKVDAGEITCVLGDNGAGKSTLIKIMSGLHQHSEGTVRVDGDEIKFNSPRDALAMGIATVYQDLAVVSLMEVWRNFFLGSEKRKRYGPVNQLAIGDMRSTAKDELAKMGINLKDINQPIGTLSGGQRTSPLRRSGSNSPGWCSNTPPGPATLGSGWCSSPTTRTTRTWSVTTSWCSNSAR